MDHERPTPFRLEMEEHRLGSKEASLVGKKPRLAGKAGRLGSTLAGPVEVLVKIRCPECGRIQVVDMNDWQTTQSLWLVGDHWTRGGYPYTCVNGHPSVEMVLDRDLGEKET